MSGVVTLESAVKLTRATATRISALQPGKGWSVSVSSCGCEWGYSRNQLGTL